MEIKEFVNKAHQNAVKHGFWERFVDMELAKKILPDPPNLWHEKIAINSMLMLIVSELAEAQEGLRHNDIANFKEELADTAIRLADLCGGLGIDLEAEIKKKMAINEKRGYLHGKAF